MIPSLMPLANEVLVGCRVRGERHFDVSVVVSDIAPTYHFAGNLHRCLNVGISSRLDKRNRKNTRYEGSVAADQMNDTHVQYVPAKRVSTYAVELILLTNGKCASSWNVLAYQ